VSLEGVKPVAPSLDTLGWFARAVDDLALMARAVRGPGVDERPAPEPGALRIGVFRGPWWARAAGETVAALDGAAARLRAGGAAVEDVAAPEGHAALGEAHAAIIYMEAGRALLAERMRDAEGLGERFTQMVDRAAAHDWRTMTAAYDAAAATRPAFDALAGGYDALLAPATVGAALEGFQDTGDPVFIKVWTLLGVPTVTLPAPVDGLPVGLQLIAPRYADGVLLAAARTVERVLAG
jgi:Asp-tRNA(Asn)/Glu-tRNA(Gln) amidotransferase A subunit family amidase